MEERMETTTEKSTDDCVLMLSDCMHVLEEGCAEFSSAVFPLTSDHNNQNVSELGDDEFTVKC